MNYIEGDGVKYDNLIAGAEIPVVIENVSVTGAADEGCILGGTSNIFTAVTSAADSVKPLCIAAESKTSTDTAVIPAYFGGKFNANKLSTGSTVTADTFTEKLRTDNIILTTAREY